MKTHVAIAPILLALTGWACGQEQAPRKAAEATVAEPLVVSPAEAYKAWKANPQGVVILDVRTPQEYQSGHVRGAQNLDFYQNFEAAVEKLPKDKIYYLHCASGRRSGMATEIMRKKGFKAYNMGGFGAVAQAGFPTE